MNTENYQHFLELCIVCRRLRYSTDKVENDAVVKIFLIIYDNSDMLVNMGHKMFILVMFIEQSDWKETFLKPGRFSCYNDISEEAAETSY